MPDQREKPYAQFSFLVCLGAGNPDSPQAGFQECSVIHLGAAGVDLRGSKDDSVGKINPVHKAADITLKRGLINTPQFQQWLNDIRSGSPGALRTVTIELQNGDHPAAGRRWKLSRARITRHTSGPLNAKGNDVAIEELALSCERLELD
jgi:phage tail-like protein